MKWMKLQNVKSKKNNKKLKGVVNHFKKHPEELTDQMKFNVVTNQESK